MSILNYGWLNKLTATFLMAMFFILTFRVFAFLPVGIIEDITTFLFILILLAFFIYEIYSQTKIKKIQTNYLYIILILLIPFFNAYQAQTVFDQPYIYGLLAQRANALILVGPFMVFMLRRGWISLSYLEKYFVFVTWFCLLIFFYYNLFVDPVQYLDTNFVTFSATRGYRFRFPNILIISLLFYCIFQVVVRRKMIYYFTIATVMIYIIFFLQDRSQLTAIAVCLFVFYIKNIPIRRKIYYAVTGIVFIIAFALFMSTFFPDVVNRYVQLYANASSLLTGTDPDDASTRLKLVEIKIAWDGFLKHPWMGNGFLSAQWNDGFLGVFEFFYPLEIGLAGNLFVFGLIGTILYYIPIFASLGYSFSLTKNMNVFLLTCQYSLLFIFLEMFSFANNMKLMGVIIFFVSIIFYFRYYFQNQLNESLSE